MSGSPIARVEGEGRACRLMDVTCALGKRDRPYPEEHGAWTVALVRRGAFNYRAADTNRVHALREGWLLLGRAGHGFECSHEHDGGDDCSSLAFDDAVFEEVARATPGCRGAILPAPILPPVPRVSALFARTRARAGDLDELAYAIAGAVVSTAHASPREGAAPTARQRAGVAAAIDAIEARADEPLSLGEVAATAGMSPYHFLRVFRRVTGTTPHQYKVGARLRRAARLLLDTARPVTEVALDVGFADLSNFVRTFHREIGCSPGAFRKTGARDVSRRASPAS